MVKVKEIKGELHEMQEIVGGYIECVRFGIKNILIVCNEEGKLQNLKPNFMFNGDVIVGDVFFCSDGEEEFESLSEEQIEFVMNAIHFYEKEQN